MDYGTGAIFGCPAHDQRDFDFASKYDLPIIPVVAPLDVFDDEGDLVAWIEQFADGNEAYLGDGQLINSDFLDGMTVADAKEEVARRLEGARCCSARPRPSARSTIACATGASRASATGAARFP